MAKWGLSLEERQLEPPPWNLDPNLLKPAKTVTDPVHRDIYLTRLEVFVLDSPALQRLRRIKQLGSTHLTYPGATHTRFAHALGTLRTSQNLLDAVRAHHSGPDPVPSLLDEWGVEFTPRWAEATVLVRLGALLHDLCHVPLGHTIEDDLGVLLPHDANWPRFSRLWALLDPAARGPLEAARSSFSMDGAPRRLVDELWPLVMPRLASAQRKRESQDLGYEKANVGGEPPPRLELKLYPFVEDIVGNTICADLLDYIKRDHYYTGLPLAVGTRFAADFYVRASSDRRSPERMVIRIERDGRRRTDVISELLKLLRYRYELNERALGHHSKLAADSMTDKMLHTWTQVLTYEVLLSAPDLAGALSDETQPVTVEDRLTALEREVPDRVAAARASTREQLEDIFTTLGDEGLLEHLSQFPATGNLADPERDIVRELALRLLNRQLFKQLGGSASPAALTVAEETYETYGKDVVRRRGVEREAARVAGVPAHHVALWVPDPRMRLKVAGVLVDAGDQPVAGLHRINADARHLTDRHKELWAVGVYAAPNVRRATRRSRILLSWIAEEMQVPMVNRKGQAVPSLSDTLTALVVERTELDESRATIRGAVEASLSAAGLGGDATLKAEDVLNSVIQDVAEGMPPVTDDWLNAGE